MKRNSLLVSPQTPIKPGTFRQAAGVWLGLALGALSVGSAQPAPTPAANRPTGEVYGRVLNASDGNYLSNARVSVPALALEVFTDNTGDFRLPRLPAGPVSLTVSSFGLAPQSVVVNVKAGESIRQDFSLRLELRERDQAGQVIALDAFSVEATRMGTQALAINEQRYAANLKNVVAAGEFGDSSEGNIADLMKYVPGVDVTYDANLPSGFSLRGFPGAQTLVMFDGGAIANSAALANGTGRAVELDRLRLNNISRVEVTKVPTPDLPANAQGGAVNVISKNGFERARPLFTYRVYQYHNSNRSFQSHSRYLKGLNDRPTQPGVNLSYELPLSKTFALSLSAGASERNFEYRQVQSEWNRAVPVPVLYRTEVVPQEVNYRAADVSLGAEWRPTAQDRVRVNVLHTARTGPNLTSRVRLIYGDGATGGPDFVQGAATCVGSAVMAGVPWTRHERVTQVNAAYVHTGRTWTTELSGYLGRDLSKWRDLDQGILSYNATLSNLIFRGEGLYGAVERSAQPVTVSATDRAGNRIDPLDGGSYTLNSVTSSAQYNLTDAKRGAKASIAREIGGGLTVKTGVAVDLQERDARRLNFMAWNFRPTAPAAERLARNYDLFDAAHAADAQSYYPNKTIRWISTAKVLDLFKARPDYFVPNLVTSHQNNVLFSKRVEETISAAYARLDWKVWENRLWLVGGVRYEHTEDEAWGPLNDISATYQRDAAGRIVRNAAGVPVRITTDALQNAQLQYRERGTYADKSYDGFYPSANASFRLREDVTLRAGYAKTIGRPNFAAIIPGVTVPDPASTSRTITVINTGLRPWTSDAFDLALETYGWKGGTGSVGVFAKDIANFFGATRVLATPELVTAYNVPEEYPGQYDGYDIETQINVGSARIRGFEASYRQPLVFLPDFLKRLQAHANLTVLNVSGPSLANFAGFTPRIFNWGVGYTGPRFSARLNANVKSRQRRAAAAIGVRGEPNSYEYFAPRTVLSADFQFQITKSLSIYGTAINLTNAPQVTEVYAPGTPRYARHTRLQRFGGDFTLGLKGSF